MESRADWDRFLTTLAVRLHACSISAFDAIMIHFIPPGKGALRVGPAPVLPIAACSASIVPAHQPHVLGASERDVQLVHADEHCSMLGDGSVSSTAGNGSRDAVG